MYEVQTRNQGGHRISIKSIMVREKVTFSFSVKNTRLLALAGECVWCVRSACRGTNKYNGMKQDVFIEERRETSQVGCIEEQYRVGRKLKKLVRPRGKEKSQKEEFGLRR